MADVTITQQIVEYYTNLLIIQYNQQPKARATISLFINELMASGVIFDVRDGYNIDTAIGLQLDILGKYIGVDRYYSTQNLTGYFSMSTYMDDPSDTTKIGFANYTDVGIKTGKWLTYNDILSQTTALSDSDFRILLKLKILQNNCNSSDGEIDNGIFNLFGELLIPQDNYDMTMNYIVDPSIFALIDIANQKGVLPKSMGVEIILLTSTA